MSLTELSIAEKIIYVDMEKVMRCVCKTVRKYRRDFLRVLCLSGQPAWTIDTLVHVFLNGKSRRLMVCRLRFL